MSKLPDGMELYGHFSVIQPEDFFRLGGVSISNQYVYRAYNTPSLLRQIPSFLATKV
jgi:hypothetical protein